MIEGLKLSITSEKLKALVEKRIEYHTKKAAYCEEKVAAEDKNRDVLRREQEEFGEESGAQFRAGTSNAPFLGTGTNWTTSFRHHKDRITVFAFMKEHLIPNETYILGEEDLQKLEVLPRW